MITTCYKLCENNSQMIASSRNSFQSQLLPAIIDFFSYKLSDSVINYLNSSIWWYKYTFIPMTNNISLISKIFHNKPNISALLKFKLFAQGVVYTTDLQRITSCFSCLLVAMFFFVFIPYLSFVRRVYTKKYQAANKR